MDGQIVGLRERLADMARQRGEQIGSLHDRAEPEKAWQLKHDVPLDPLARQCLFEQLRPGARFDADMSLRAVPLLREPPSNARMMPVAEAHPVLLLKLLLVDSTA